MTEKRSSGDFILKWESIVDVNVSAPVLLCDSGVSCTSDSLNDRSTSRTSTSEELLALNREFE
jgi:hypothetical protein